MEIVTRYARLREDNKNKVKKGARLHGIPKLEDANKAGTKESAECTLIVTEGDSAKALAVAGLSVVGRDLYGVYPVRGKFLNVRDATEKRMAENQEILELKRILGLQSGADYAAPEGRATLRYGRVMLMTDQDADGSHIKGLFINFVHVLWPSLVHHNGFLLEFVTPLIKASKGKQTHSFFSLAEFRAWPEDRAGWRIKYYKGLGTSSSAEAREYFSNLERHVKVRSPLVLSCVGLTKHATRNSSGLPRRTMRPLSWPLASWTGQWRRTSASGGWSSTIPRSLWTARRRGRR